MSTIYVVFIVSHVLLALSFGQDDNYSRKDDDWSRTDRDTPGRHRGVSEERQNNVNSDGSVDLLSLLIKFAVGILIIAVLVVLWQRCGRHWWRQNCSASRREDFICDIENTLRRYGQEVRSRPQQPTRPLVNAPGPQNNFNAPRPRENSAVQEVNEYLARIDPSQAIPNRDYGYGLPIGNEHLGAYDQGGYFGITDNAAGGPRSAGITGQQDRYDASELETLLEQHNSHLKNPAIHLDVQRDVILQDLLYLYGDPNLGERKVTVEMRGERSMDGPGVRNDMFTAFWNEAQEKYFKGNEAVIPYLPKNRWNAEETYYRILGRILSHTIAVTKALPILLCKSAIIVMVFDTTDVDKQTILEDFLLFLDLDDRHLVTAATRNFRDLDRDQIDELQTIFTRFDYSFVVQERTFPDHLSQLARDTICITPKPLLDLMRQGIPDAHLEHFWRMLNITNINVLFHSLRPSRQDVIDSLSPDSPDGRLTPRQMRVLQYLRDLINEMNQTELEAFLHFVTGKKSLPRHGIIVWFTYETGLQRVPKAHTCSNMLELPETYENYSVFKSELTHLLSSDEAFTMSMA